MKPSVRSVPGKETALHAALQQAADKLKRRGMLFLISDCFDDVAALLTALRYFRHTGSEVAVFQVWDRDELDFPFHSRTQFRSLEIRTQEHIVDPNALRKAYRERVGEFRRQLASGCAKERIDLVECITDQPVAELLKAYIFRRNGQLPTDGQKLASLSSEAKVVAGQHSNATVPAGVRRWTANRPAANRGRPKYT